jgi:hypothetical protein
MGMSGDNVKTEKKTGGNGIEARGFGTALFLCSNLYHNKNF